MWIERVHGMDLIHGHESEWFKFVHMRLRRGVAAIRSTIMRTRIGRLFPNTAKVPPFLDGLARVLDIGATFDPLDLDQSMRSDSRAIESDWEAVGLDMAQVVRERTRR